MEQAVVYARYSSHNQTEMSIEGQLDAAQTYAKKHGLNIIRTYEDRAKTGTNDKRPAFQRMLEDCKKHQFSVIIVWKVDRFGRNKEEITFNKYKCKKEGVRVEYVAESIGEGNEAVILESVLEGMAEYYSKQLSTNVKRGQAIAKAQGRWHGGTVPFGFMVEDHKLVPNPAESKVVQNIFQLYADGATVQECMDICGKARSSVNSILRKVEYREKIVPAEVWDRCNERIEKHAIRRITKEEHVREYILTSKMYCSCGEKYVGSYGCSTKYKYYYCGGKKRGTGCKARNFKKEITEAAILSAIRNALSDPDEIIEGVWQEYLKYKDAPKKGTEEAVKRLSQAEKGIENILDSIEKGVDYNLMKSRMEKLQRQKEEAEQEIQEADQMFGIELTKGQVRKYLKVAMTIEDPLLLVERFVRRINVTDTGFEVLLNVSEDFRICDRWPGRVVV